MIYIDLTWLIKMHIIVVILYYEDYYNFLIGGVKMKKTYIKVNKWNAQKIIQTMETGNFDPLYIESSEDWRILSAYGEISESLIDKYKDYWDWFAICCHQPMSEEFIRSHMDYITPNIHVLCIKQNLSREFIKDYEHIISWKGLSINKNLTSEMKEEFHEHLAEYLKMLEKEDW